MTTDSAIAPELLTAEIEAIEDLLVHYEDWRALAQLEIRERKGEVPNSVATSSLKAMLIEKLAANPLFLRRQTLLKELERATQSVHTPGQPITSRKRQQPEGDDLTRIRGIDARLERRLNALNVRSYDQIASFTLDNVRYVSNTLGLENRIISQMWIEQAQMLAEGDDDTPPAPSLDALRVRSWPSSSPAQGKVPPREQQPRTRLRAADLAPGVRVPNKPAATAPVPPAIPGKSDPEKPDARYLQPEPRLAGPPRESPAAAKETAESAAPSSPPAAKPVEAAKPVAPEAAVDVSISSAAPVVAKAEEPSYADLAPPKPISAAKYKTAPPEAVVPPQAAASSTTGSAPSSAPAHVVPNVQEPDYSKLRPAMPLPGRRYAGAILESLDHGVLAGTPPPPKPRPASAYVGAPADPVANPAVVEPRRPEQAAAPARAAAAQATRPPQDRKESAEPAAKASDDGKRAADIVGQNLPPLPLRPASAVSPAPPLPRTPLAAAPPPVSAPKNSAVAPASGAAQAAAAAAKEAAMLAAASARPGRPASPVSVPPPLPPEAVKSSPASPLRAPPPALSPTPSPRAERELPEQRPVFEEHRSSVPSGEARVTIRRSEDQGSGRVIRNPGATEVHLGREQHRASNFDSKAYAAYHDEVEEASVQIVRRKDAPAKGAGVSAAVSAAGAAAKAAAAALTKKVENNVPVQPAAAPSAETPANPPPVAENAKVPIGRFLKALTGQ